MYFCQKYMDMTYILTNLTLKKGQGQIQYNIPIDSYIMGEGLSISGY